MSEETLTIICDHGEVITARFELLKKIPYFRSILEGGFKESQDKTLDLSDVSRFACENLLSFVEHGKVELPISSFHCEECLGLARYWDLQEYIDVFLKTCIDEVGEEKGYIVEIINYLALTEKMNKHRDWLDQKIHRLPTITRIHMLLPEAVESLVNLYQDTKKERYLFPLLRDWYLFDQTKDKVETIVKLLDRCPLTDFGLMPRHQTYSFVNVFPDPALAKKIALWVIGKITI